MRATRRHRYLPALLVSLLCAASQAQTVWNHPSSTSWATAGNWSNGLPNASRHAQFGAITNSTNVWGISGTASTVQAIELTSDRTANVTIGASGNSGGTLVVTLGGATINSLANTILRNNSSYALNFQSHNGQNNPNTLTFSLSNATDSVIAIDGSGGITVGVSITGSNRHITLVGDGSGSLTLSGENTFSGGFTMSSGTTLHLNHESALGTGAFVVAGGTLDNTSGSSLANANDNAQTWSGDFTFTGTNNLDLGTGAVTISGGSRTVTVNAGTLTVAGAIGDGGNTFGLTKSGAGTLALSGNNTYAGGTTISGGTLTADHDNALGTGSVSVNTGGTLAINNVTLANSIHLDGGSLHGVGATNRVSGTLSGTGSLTGPLTLTESAIFQWHLASANTSGANSLSVASGALTILNGAKIELSFAGGVQPISGAFWDSTQTWTVISAGSGSIAGTSLAVSQANNATWNNLGDFHVTLDGGSLLLIWTPHTAAIPEPSTYAAWFGAAALVGAGWYRRRQRNRKD